MDAELKKLWNDKRNAEKEFLKCKNPLIRRRQLKDKYTQTQFIIDKRIRFYKRQFRRGQALQLDQLKNNNPQQFWKEINKLGPKKLKKKSNGNYIREW